MAYEYFLKFWGGAESRIEKELGIQERDFWFDTKEEREIFVRQLQPYIQLGLALRREEGEDVRLQTIAKIVATYKEKTYSFDFNFGYAYPIEAAYFAFEEGNYSCDCNLSNFIQKSYPEFEELDCGEEIHYSVEVITV